MPLHHICYAIRSLRAVLLYHAYITRFSFGEFYLLVNRIILFFRCFTFALHGTHTILNYFVRIQINETRFTDTNMLNAVDFSRLPCSCCCLPHLPTWRPCSTTINKSSKSPQRHTATKTSCAGHLPTRRLLIHIYVRPLDFLFCYSQIVCRLSLSIHRVEIAEQTGLLCTSCFTTLTCITFPQSSFSPATLLFEESKTNKERKSNRIFV